MPGLDKSDDVQLPTADPLLDVGAFVVYRLSVQQPYANDAEWIATMDASQYGRTRISTVEQLIGSDTLFTIAERY